MEQLMYQLWLQAVSWTNLKCLNLSLGSQSWRMRTMNHYRRGKEWPANADKVLCKAAAKSNRRWRLPHSSSMGSNQWLTGVSRWIKRQVVVCLILMLWWVGLSRTSNLDKVVCLMMRTRHQNSLLKLQPKFCSKLNPNKLPKSLKKTKVCLMIAHQTKVTSVVPQKSKKRQFTKNQIF